MKQATFGLAISVLLAASAQAQETRLTIVPGHDKIIQQYVVTEHVQPVTLQVPLAIGATIPDGIRLAPVPLAMVAKVSNTEKVKHAIDLVITFKGQIPAAYHKQTYPYIDGALKALAKKKLDAGLKEQADFIDAKVEEETKKGF